MLLQFTESFILVYPPDLHLPEGGDLEALDCQLTNQEEEIEDGQGPKWRAYSLKIQLNHGISVTNIRDIGKL